MSIERTLERIADALERIAAINEGEGATKIEISCGEPDPLDAPTPEPEKSEPEKPLSDRAKLKARLTELGVEFKDSARTYTLEKLLAAADNQVTPDPTPEPEPAQKFDDHDDTTPPEPEKEEEGGVTRDQFADELAKFVIANGRDAGVALLINCGADKEDPKISDLDGAGRAKGYEEMKG